MTVVYTAIVHARPGREDELAALYQANGERLKAASGFRGRHVLRERPGAYMQEALAWLTAQGKAPAGGGEGHGHDHGAGHGEPAGVRFISIEIWDSAADRVAFGLDPASQAVSQQMIPLMQEAHSHELYEDIGGAH